MNKIAVTVYLPALAKSYDAILPVGMKTGEAAKLLKGAVSEQESVHIKNESLMLAAIEKKCVLDDDLTLSNAGIKDGYTLILV